MNPTYVLLPSSSDPTRIGSKNWWSPKPHKKKKKTQQDLAPPKSSIQKMSQNREPYHSACKVNGAYLTYWLTRILFKATKLASVSYSLPNFPPIKSTWHFWCMILFMCDFQMFPPKKTSKIDHAKTNMGCPCLARWVNLIFWISWPSTVVDIVCYVTVALPGKDVGYTTVCRPGLRD